MSSSRPDPRTDDGAWGPPDIDIRLVHKERADGWTVVYRPDNSGTSRKWVIHSDPRDRYEMR